MQQGWIMTSANLLRAYPAKAVDVYLFATCLIDQFDPQAGLNAVRLLEREGIRVHFPQGQTCCGQPAHGSGFPDEARAVAARQLRLFPHPWPVIVLSGSCAGMMRHHYPSLFAADPALADLARDVADRVFELTEYLLHVVGFDRPDLGSPCRVALHTSCHARRQMGVHISGRQILDALAQVTVVEPERVQECCGFGGTFAVRFPDISQAMVGDKLDAVLATGASQLVSADCGCLLNILGHAAHRQAALTGQHVASFLWQRTGDQP